MPGENPVSHVGSNPAEVVILLQFEDFAIALSFIHPVAEGIRHWILHTRRDLPGENQEHAGSNPARVAFSDLSCICLSLSDAVDSVA